MSIINLLLNNSISKVQTVGSGMLSLDSRAKLSLARLAVRQSAGLYGLRPQDCVVTPCP